MNALHKLKRYFCVRPGRRRKSGRWHSKKILMLLILIENLALSWRPNGQLPAPTPSRNNDWCFYETYWEGNNNFF